MSISPERAQQEIDALRVNLQQSQEVMQRQNAILEEITCLPRPCGVILHHEQAGKTAFISFENKVLEVAVSPDAVDDIHAGDTVSLSSKTMAILEPIIDYAMTGPLLIVDDIINGDCKVDFSGNPRTVRAGQWSGLIKKGDRILADESCTIVMDHLGKMENRFTVVESNGITWDDIGGLHNAKRDIIESIIEPVKQAELYRFYGRKPTKGILLYGPPRCGKTMLVKATTTAVGEAFGKKAIASGGFIYVKGPEILSKYVGIAEATVGQLFRRTREFKATHGYPAILFIDEAEAILSKRGSGISSDIEKTIVPMFLSEMDGLEETGAVIILATNRPDILDPAIVQEGRIDRKIYIGRPDRESALDIFGVHMRDIPLGSGISREKMIKTGVDELFCSDKRMYKISFKKKRKPMYFTFGDICSGGMIAEIVQSSITHAMRRDMAPQVGRGRKPNPGVRCIDIENAVKKSFSQNRHIDHTDDLATFVEGFRNDVLNVERIVA